ncbi:hypothetical protein TRIP_B220005 [uncultured Desulfatiglans sp.]|nr:hypothetical protein TRIP_B220005 [uncultured Desulfatiglans sp.]
MSASARPVYGCLLQADLGWGFPSLLACSGFGAKEGILSSEKMTALARTVRPLRSFHVSGAYVPGG